jgi:pyruvate dehydrogenase E2 component (dihydrolipoamide acetyltransferase)
MATKVLVPPLGQTVDTVTLVAWHRQEGEAVRQGEMLFAIETDKAVLDVEAPASGVLRRVTAQPGDRVTVLTAVALIATADEVLPSVPVASRKGPGVPPADKVHAGSRARVLISPRARRLAEQQGVPWQTLLPTGPEGAIVERDVRACLGRQQAPVPSITPVARRVAEAAGLDWRDLAGSGPGGRVMRQDVTRAAGQPPQIAEQPGKPRAEADQQVLETIPLQGTRGLIAGRMLASATTTAPVTLNAEADARRLVKLRRLLAQEGVNATYNDLLLAILGRALTEYPRLNASLAGDEIRVWRRIDIGLAVDADRGLLVPVVRDVARKGLAQMAQETRALVERARAGRCAPEELTGGTFTLTNLGMFGIDSFTPIINLPECAILGVGRIKKRPAVAGGRVVTRRLVWLSLTFDHRLVDGGPAARFMQRVVQLVERPHLLLT